MHDNWKSPTKGNPEHKRPQRLEDLTSEEKLRKSCDIKATNIIFSGTELTLQNDQVSLKGLEQVIEQGSWLIRSTPLILNKWTPNIVLNKDEVTKVSVWVKMHKVPVVSYSKDGLSLIATQIDKALKHEVVMAVSKEDGVQNDDTIEVAEASGDKNDFFYAQELIKDGAESEVEELNIDSSTKQARKGASTPSSLGCNVDVVSLMVIAQSSQALHVKLIHKANNGNLYCSFMYAEDVSSGSSSMNSAMSDFKDYVANIKALDVNCSVVQKMKALMKSLRTLLHDQGNLHDRVSKLRPELDEVQKSLDLNPVDVSLRDEKTIYVQAFSDAKLDEEHFLKQKYKVEWLEAKDTNSAYFKKKKFLGSSMSYKDLDVADLFSNQVLNNSNIKMVWDISNEEIKAAMFDIGDDRAPGLNGYTSALFKKGWDIVGWICILLEIHHTFIALIPKVVSENQSVFVPGRRISDNILITQELMHHYHWDRGPPMCAFKVDIQKAYDTVDWRFLEIILVHFGFHPTMIKWFMVCVMSASFSLSINGDIYSFMANMEANGEWLWPQAWLQKAPLLGMIPAPNLDNNRVDLARWRDLNRNMNDFSIKCAWEAIRPRGTSVVWYQVVCFNHNIPRHAFHLWLVMHQSLKPQDRMRQWDVGVDIVLNLLRCPLCESQRDSHEHLLCECTFSAQIWSNVRHLAGMDHVQPVLNDIVLFLQHMANRRTTISIIRRLTLVASSYYIGLERTTASLS
ncbi:aspartic peptidase, partial [Tanacetum coccineum]